VPGGKILRVTAAKLLTSSGVIPSDGCGEAAGGGDPIARVRDQDVVRLRLAAGKRQSELGVHAVRMLVVEVVLVAEQLRE
jgi:hypothetical protein